MGWGAVWPWARHSTSLSMLLGSGQNCTYQQSCGEVRSNVHDVSARCLPPSRCLVSGSYGYYHYWSPPIPTSNTCIAQALFQMLYLRSLICPVSHMYGVGPLFLSPFYRWKN